MQSTPRDQTPARSLRRQAQEARFGPLSLGVFTCAVLVIAGLFLFLEEDPGSYLAAVGLMVILGGGLSIISAALAIVGLRWREHPHWPALVALTLSSLPALVGILILGYGLFQTLLDALIHV